MESSRRYTRGIESHPGSVNMLDRNEVRMLTQILHLDNTGVMQNDYIPRIERLIQNLPKRLRRPRRISLNFSQSAGRFCDLHSPLNGDLISDVFFFVQIEVTQHFRLFEEHPGLCHPVEEEILSRLRALRGMWTQPSHMLQAIPNAWHYQINGCHACMLARVASDMEALRNLRVVILSRTRTRKKHRPRTLMVFVDECINQFPGDNAEEIYNTSNQLAFGMKAARKACTRAEFRKRGFGHRPHSKHQHHRHSRSKERSTEQTDRPESKAPITSLMKIPEHEAAAASVSSLPTLDIWGDDFDRRQSEGGVLEEEFLSRHSHDSQYPQGVSRSRSTPMTGEISLMGNIGAGSVHPCRDAVDGVIEMYKSIARGNPYSQATPVPSAMVLPLNTRKTHGKMSMARNRAVDEIAPTSNQYARMDLTILVPPSSILPNSDLSKTSRDIPPEYQYSPSAYSSSDWVDDECTDSDWEPAEDCNFNARSRQKPAAETTWDLVCDHHRNMI